MYPPEISDFAYVTDRAYTTAQIRDMEMTILRVLKFKLGRPLPLQFLRRASKIYEVCVLIQLYIYLFFVLATRILTHVRPQVTAEQHTLAKYLLELTMVDYDMVHFPPSMVASAALAFTLKILDAGEWVSLISDEELDFLMCTRLSHSRSHSCFLSVVECTSFTKSIPQLAFFFFFLHSLLYKDFNVFCQVRTFISRPVECEI